MTIDEADLREFIRDIERLAERIGQRCFRCSDECDVDVGGIKVLADQIVRAIQNRRMRGELPR